MFQAVNVPGIFLSFFAHLYFISLKEINRFSSVLIIKFDVLKFISYSNVSAIVVNGRTGQVGSN